MKLPRTMTLFAAVVMASAASAQTVTAVEGVATAPTIIFSAGKYKSCGLRFVGLPIDYRRPVFPALAWDINIAIHFGEKTALGLLKTSVTRLKSQEEVRTAKGQEIRVASTWIQREGGEPLKGIGTPVRGENGLSSLTPYPAVEISRYLADAATSADMHFLLGIQLVGESGTRVFRFSPEVNKEDGMAYLQCITALLKQVDAALQERP